MKSKTAFQLVKEIADGQWEGALSAPQLKAEAQKIVSGK